MRRAWVALVPFVALIALARPASALVVERIGPTVRRHAGDVRACYLRALSLRPELRGRLVVRITVEGSGVVSAAHIESDSIGDPSLQQCVLGAVRGWQFPTADEAETVTLPFDLAN